MAQCAAQSAGGGRGSMSNKCIYDYAHGILKYPLAVIFLIEHYLTWKHIEAALRGDPATNISAGLARFSGFVGKLLRWLR